MGQRPTIAIFFTGGTISMTRAADPSAGAVPTLKGADIRASVPTLEADFELRCHEFGQYPGPHMTPARVMDLARRAHAEIAAGATGVVIAHGTDTLEETAFLLDCTLPAGTPTVLVGAMRTRDELSWDGPVNLHSACMVASDPACRGMGTLVVMNNTICSASEVTKTYTDALDTFVSPNGGPLGVVDLDAVRLYRRPLRRMEAPILTPDRLPMELPHVELIEAVAGADGRLFRAAIAGGARGMVVAAMGRGNVPPPLADAIGEAAAAGVPVVICSRCWGGHVAPVYGYRGGGAELVRMGAVFAPWLNGPKARLALALGIAAGMDREGLRRMFRSTEVGA